MITATTLAVFALALFRLALVPAQAVTMAFVTLALAQLWHVFNMREAGSGWLANEVSRNPYVWGAVALCLALIGAALGWPALSALLQLPSPGGAGLALAVAASFVPLGVGQWLLAGDARARRRAAGRGGGPA
ncbi:hypothetical protein G3580_07710 [Nitrogeniibacter mangrovi]|uniref:Cation-transporting P-type ATPase C-terminal domain-containing protein n=1 Tax=Nitrogeniibacter mangrovi TaxID=2016596 RepID=A0A6C1B3V8_9RHOO|nr:cation-translocating P-type ATPase C-terminal domain-containing protein [Nitrogeniibacter mangrovi]QID17538.1 hypothetical protein G3580_07710 [Nitrogeniibacter mangrovi]